MISEKRLGGKIKELAIKSDIGRLRKRASAEGKSEMKGGPCRKIAVSRRWTPESTRQGLNWGRNDMESGCQEGKRPDSPLQRKEEKLVSLGITSESL